MDNKLKARGVPRGSKLSEKHKRNIRLATRTEEYKQKQSEKLKGHWVNPRTIEHIKTLNKGKFGKDHPCYKKVKKDPFYKSVRKLFKYRQWRSDVFKRDNFKCILCGKMGYVEADHYPVRFIEIIKKYYIKTLEQAISCKELWDINNGRTLCKRCHLANTKRK